MKRIHFTAQDLMRTRLAATIGTAAETLDSVKLLHAPDAGLAFRRWRVAVRGRLDERARPLLALLPPRGPDLDVRSLAGDSGCVEEAVERLLSAPRALLRAEFEHISFRPAHRAWARNLVDGDRETWLQVTAALRACHGVAVAPYGNRVRSHLAEARAAYANAMAEGGVEHLLKTLGGPMLRWRPPVLELEHPHEADVRLDGRGLVIAPTLFSTRRAELMLSVLDPAEPPVLAVPTVTDALGGALWDGADASTGRALEELLGRTRAAVLEAAADGRSTTDLARRLGISPATVSHHTSVLRGAGLVATRREGKAVLHTVTSMGRALLEPGARLL
ncbi:ArsR/SmtB family transcription factor [Streptomyces sp. NPDC057242]|uniref:ArsR/SmtB family transcription factor n=1 Tax=unclassified Streptomyces TaxID=2593676 RepID=UPI00362D969F